MNESALNPELVVPESPGTTLSAERKKQNLTEREVADRLKITLSKLRDIESDKFESFPAKIYLRGYLKNYARLLMLSEKAIIESYEAHDGDREDEEPFTFPQENPTQSQSRKGLLALLAAAVAAIVLVFLFTQKVATPADADDAALIFEQAIEEPVDSQLDTTAVDKAPLLVEVVPAITGELEQGGAAQTAENLVSATKPDVIEVSSEAVEMLASKLTAVELINLSAPEVEVPAAEVEVVSLSDVLDFRFVAQCWIEVRDSAGGLLYSGLENAGSQRKIEGEAPFQVVIGNAEGAALSINGQSVALQAPVNGRALRLEVGS